MAALSLLPPGALRILDVGCGAGANARALKETGVTVHGITLSVEEAEAASAFCEQVFVHDVEGGLPRRVTGPYDAVLCSHILEHLFNPQPLLSAIKERLAATPESRGCLVVALPNILFWKQRVELLRGRFEYREKGLTDSTHVRFYTFASAKRLLQEAGFTVEVATVEGHFPLPGLRKVLPGVAQSFDRFCCRRWPGLFGWQMLYRCRPRTPPELQADSL